MQRVLALLAAVVVIALAVVQWVRPLPPPVATVARPRQRIGQAPALPWPTGTEAALSVPQAGFAARYGPQQPLPIGSVAKMMTAYLLLKKFPLSPTSASGGPSLLVTPADVRLYQEDAATQQSVAPVTAGQRLSERKVLEGLLVASGNNLATMTARWVSGSQRQFVALMNQTARALGMHHTHYAGPSGLNPATVSTPADQVRLAEVAMQIPVFAQIVAMPQISWPGSAQPIFNYNYEVGHDGIVGVKTGSTTQAGGCFVFAAPHTVGTQRVMIYGAVLGQFASQTGSQLQLALADGVRLLNAVKSHLQSARLVQAGQTVGSLHVPWSRSIALVATKTLTVPLWPGTQISEQLAWHPQGAGGSGSLLVNVGGRRFAVPVRQASPVPPPSIRWKLLRL